MQHKIISQKGNKDLKETVGTNWSGISSALNPEEPKKR